LPRLIDVSIISGPVLSDGRVARPSVRRPSRELFVGPPGIIAGRVSITAVAIIGLVLLLFICGAQAQGEEREREREREGEREEKRTGRKGKKRQRKAFVRADDWIGESARGETGGK